MGAQDPATYSDNSMTLRNHIDTNHKGVIADFSRAHGVSHSQVCRWLKYGCIWIDGQVWKQQSKLSQQ